MSYLEFQIDEIDFSDIIDDFENLDEQITLFPHQTDIMTQQEVTKPKRKYRKRVKNGDQSQDEEGQKARERSQYEKKRMEKALEAVKDFNMKVTEPYIWMIRSYGKLIQHKKFNRIFMRLKSEMPVTLRPNRSVSRNEALRMKWLDDVWSNHEARRIVQSLIDSEMKSK